VEPPFWAAPTAHLSPRKKSSPLELTRPTWKCLGYPIPGALQEKPSAAQRRLREAWSVSRSPPAGDGQGSGHLFGQVHVVIHPNVHGDRNLNPNVVTVLSADLDDVVRLTVSERAWCNPGDNPTEMARYLPRLHGPDPSARPVFRPAQAGRSYRARQATRCGSESSTFSIVPSGVV